MYICPVCNNDTFIYHNTDVGRMATCTVCLEEYFDDEDDEDEYIEE